LLNIHSIEEGFQISVIYLNDIYISSCKILEKICKDQFYLHLKYGVICYEQNKVFPTASIIDQSSSKSI